MKSRRGRADVLSIRSVTASNIEKLQLLKAHRAENVMSLAPYSLGIPTVMKSIPSNANILPTLTAPVQYPYPNSTPYR